MNYKDYITSKNFNPGFYIIKVFILYLTNMFKANESLGFIPDEVPNDLTIYDDTQKQKDALRSLLITTKFDFEEKFRGKTPCVIVSRRNLVYGSFGTNAMSRMSNISNDNSTTRYKDIVSVPIVIECISTSDLEAEALASICQSFIHIDDRVLRKTGIKIQIAPSQTPAQFFNKDQQTFISSVVLQVALEVSYGVNKIEDNLLEQIDFTSDTNQSIIVK